MAAPLSRIWSVYSKTYLPRLAPKTREGYRTAWGKTGPLGARPTAARIEQWRSGLARRYSTAYTNMCLRVLQLVVRRGALLAGGDPELCANVLSVPALREDALEPRCPPPDFRERALRVAENPAERAWLRLAGEGGLRKGELLGLRPAAIDFDKLEVRVDRQRKRTQRKNRRPHTVEIDAALAADLRWAIDHRDEIRPRSGWHRGCSDGFVFPWGEKYLEAFLERIRASFGAARDRYLPKGNAWHCWRHAMASAAAEAGETEIQIANRLGDADTSMASRYVASRRGATRARLTGHSLPCHRVEQVGRPRALTRGLPSPTFSHPGMVPGMAWEWVTTEDSYGYGTQPQQPQQQPRGRRSR